jgi:SPP1 gp7 family putative phage head morphogenesis protein
MATVDTLTSVYSSHAVYLERVAAKLGNDVLPYLESIEERIGVVLNAMPNRILSNQELNAVRSEISKITSEELQAYATQYKLDNKELGEHEVAFHARTLDSVTDGYESSIPSLGVLNSVAIGAPIKVGDNQFTTYGRYVSSYWQQYTKVIDDSVAAGFIQGGTNREIATRIRDAITLDSPDGDLSKAMRAAKTMTRTGTNHYATQATVAFVDANDRVLTGYRFLATLDNRTSRQCSANDQVVFKKGEPMPTPPLHPNCRSRLIYEIDGRFSFDDSASTRPSNFTDADGDRDPKRVSSKKTYHESLKAMSEEDRIAILGSPLGKALTKMDADTFAKSLIDSTFEPLTISEMKKRDNELGRILKAMDRG